jgi:rRNA-processing protein FCF1
MSRIYISDTNIWIDFNNAGILDELFQLPFSLCCTDFVLAELNDTDQAKLCALGLLVEQMDGASIPRLYDLMAAHNNSSLADVSCYQLAQETGRPLLTGDGRLRRQALEDGIEVYGALWLLDRLVEQEVIVPGRAADCLESMLAQNARLPHTECQKRLLLWRA